MAVSTYNAEFWRYYLNEELRDFRDITRHDSVLNNCRNVFNEEKRHDLTINLINGTCSDGEGLEYPLSEFIAAYKNLDLDDVEHQIQMDFARWEERQDVAEQYREFTRDEESLRWKRKRSKDSDSYIEVTEYDIVINSIIESYDLKVDKWNRKFECTLRWFKFGKIKTKEIELTPEQTHSFNDFSKSIWDEATILTKNLSNDDMRRFWHHIETYFEPRIVREFKHYGFIEFENEKYFMAENVLIKFPDSDSHPLELIAKNNGAFRVEENKFVKPSDDPIYLPHFELGVPQDGQYKAAMNRLYDSNMFERKLQNNVIEEFCSMVGNDSEFRQWGKLIVGYIFSYIFFEDIYDRFNHTIFLYFFGQGNVGKGEVVKRILDFYGISYQDSLNTPPPRSVDEALEQKSQIPLWVDEHVPQVPGQDHKIEDQEWNSWFELKMRRTNIKTGLSYGLERKAVRTMPVFCSNFRPTSDHLLSRCLIVEYKRERRGPEKHVYNLKNNKELLQRLMLSYLQHYKLLNRSAFKWDIGRMRDRLKSDVKKELDKRSGEAIMQDRQISQFATLITVYHWLFADYRDEITHLYHDAQVAEKETDPMYRKELHEALNLNLADVQFDEELYQFVKQETTRAAVTAAQHDPLTDYIETISTLIEGGDIHERHFHWMDDGTLKIWSRAVWDKYLSAKKGTNDVVRREVVEDKLRDLSELDDEGGLKNIVWTPKNSIQGDDSKVVRCKGFYIPSAASNELLAMGFQVHKFNPKAARSAGAGEAAGARENTPVNVTDNEDDAPF